MAEVAKAANTNQNENKGEENQEWDEDESKQTNSSESKKFEKTFTQDYLNKMMTREKQQGRNAILKELGLDPDNKTMMDMIKAIISSQKSDDRKQLETKLEENDKLAEANKRALIAEAKAEAMQLGVQTQYVEDAVTLVLAKKTDDSDVKTLVGELKTKYPIWFEKVDETKEDKAKKVGQKGTGSSVNTSKEKNGETKKEEGLGARLAAKRAGQNKAKTSYWGKT